MNVIDLFSGAGGLSLGAARAGFSIHCAIESDSQAMNVHRLNFPNTLHFQTDVSIINGAKLMTELGLKKGELTGVIGGPPCQGFSCMGKRTVGDKRNNLFVDFFRIVSDIQPRFFLAENVPGIMNEQNANLRNVAFRFVERKYTMFTPMLISAHEFGAPTTRTRVFFIGIRKNEKISLSSMDFLPSPRIEQVRVREALHGLPLKIDPTWQNEEESWRKADSPNGRAFSRAIRGNIPRGVGDKNSIRRLENEQSVSGCLGTLHSAKILSRYSQIRQGERDAISKSSRLMEDGFCPTIRAGTGQERGSFQAVRPLHPTENRVITPREAARLQGFPDWFQFSPTKWHSFRQIGNSVSPILAEYILSIIFQAIA